MPPAPNFKNHPKAPEYPSTDKEQLYKKLWEENNLLKDIHMKKRNQMAQLKEKISKLTEGIDQANETIKSKGSDLMRLKGAVEEAQRQNVGHFNKGLHDRGPLPQHPA